MKFRLTPAGTTSSAAKLYQIPRDPMLEPAIRYESVRGLLQAGNIRLIPDSEPERMEDGSLAPWAKVLVDVYWGPHLGWKTETVRSSRVVPNDAMGPDNTINPFRWTDKEDP